MLQDRLAIGRYQTLLGPTLETLNLVAFAILACGAAYYLFSMESQRSLVIAALVALAAALRQLEMLAKSFPRVSKSLPSLSRLEKTLELAARQRSTKSDSRVPRHSEQLRLNQIQFAYGHREPAAVSDLNFKIDFGDIVALVGVNGSGKTTLLRLLAGILEADEGEIWLDGEKLSPPGSNDLTSQISLVPQEPLLFACTIRENLTIGRPETTEKEIERIYRLCGLESFLGPLKTGLETRLLDGGSGLSGGQKQKLSIGRALLRDPSILLMDEPSGHLDSLSERVFENCLRDLRGTRTVVVATHRESTIALADEIIVLDRGRCVGHGTHAALMSESLAYRRLVEVNFEPIPIPAAGGLL
jgi:ATP-binding cassette subfamily B protein